MDSSLAQIIQTGNDITAFKYYGVTTVTILCYEYLAMLPDEIKYAWSFKKTWVFYLFLLVSISTQIASVTSLARRTE